MLPKVKYSRIHLDTNSKNYALFPTPPSKRTARQGEGRDAVAVGGTEGKAAVHTAHQHYDQKADYRV